jgi:hypothetical protein
VTVHVLDGEWEVADLRAAASEFPPPGSLVWKTYTADEERGKQECDRLENLGLRTLELVNRLASPAWVGRVEELTGVPDLIPDLHGGGMHQVTGGGRLALHRDFNVHPYRNLHRRVNCIVYLNEGWTHSDGGQLTVRDDDGERTILPVLNRTVIFPSQTWHGHPVPVAPGRERKSVAVYYYTEDPPPDYTTAHSTEWLEGDQ